MHPEGLHIARHHDGAVGPPVVLVHGAPDRSKSFAQAVERLDDLPITLYDRRGYGYSCTPGAPGVGFDVHADDLIAVLDETPSVVVAHSAGCAIAMLTATCAPELFLALGVWEPPMTAWEWSSRELRELSLAYGRSTDPEATIEAFSRTVLGDTWWEQLPERARDRLRAEAPAFCADMASQESQFFELDAFPARAWLAAATNGPRVSISTLAQQRRSDSSCSSSREPATSPPSPNPKPGPDSYAQPSNSRHEPTVPSTDSLKVEENE
jgi:pimeloyl-ACP methyl ester carboxylesterase